MNKIKILSHQEAQKIAAGEVVERPANIVKELCENSIDAGATQISLYIEKSGKNLIRIVDNGCGMSAVDALACFLPHATSKITSVDDLVSIQSFGFRGEALASISAVSKIKLITKEQSADDQLGVQVTCADGGVLTEERVACSVGTDLWVQDLFYNIPARKKFLKQDETEWNQIQSLVHAFCLSHTNLYFKLFHDNKLVLNAPPVTTIKDRASQMWGYNFSQNLLELKVQAQDDDPLRPAMSSWFKIHGLISHHHFWRYGKSSMFFFVNQRWVKDHELSKAVMKGYLNVLPPGKFPAVFLFVTVDADHIDINVHPKKEEVRFLKPHALQVSLQEHVKRTLEQNVTKSLHQAVKQDEVIGVEFVARTVPAMVDFLQESEASEVKFSVRPDLEQDRRIEGFERKKIAEFTPEQKNLIQKHDAISHQASYSFKLIGQLFNTYLIFEHDDECVIIDQHAAHERILYEKFLKNFEQRDGTTLLFPELVKLPEHQLQAVLREKEFFAQQGIELELFGKQEIAIKTAPPKIQSNALKELIIEVADFIEENEMLDKEVFRKKLHEHVHSHMACKMAVRAGDVLTSEQMHQLIKDLQTTEKRFICVHGRPTTWIISKEEIEKKFRRR